MREFSKALNSTPGMRYIAELLELHSTVGRHYLMQQPFMTSVNDITTELLKVESFIDIIKEQGNEAVLQSVYHALAEIHDITGTLKALKSGTVLDDIGLFEIKRFALIADRLKRNTEELKADRVKFRDQSEVILILDPDKQRVPHFYIYDSYDSHLASLRKSYNQLTSERSINTSAIENEKLIKAGEIRGLIVEAEDRIREELAHKLKAFAVNLLEDLRNAAELDVLLAKANIALNLKLTKPVPGNTTVYKGLFNPAIAAILKSQNKQYQSVDIAIHNSPILITGANMGGKTVLLKSVQLAQMLFQYGFYVPAAQAVIVPVEEIMTSMEDEQSELRGLSSFASEMLKINNIIQKAREGNPILALIDEPASTTNPQEGLALVNALLEMLDKKNVISLVTTHYSGIQVKCRHLRVAGLRKKDLMIKPTIDSINDLMDYSLIESDPGSSTQHDAPNEALRIAELLEIDKELLDKATYYITIKPNINAK